MAKRFGEALRVNEPSFSQGKEKAEEESVFAPVAVSTWPTRSIKPYLPTPSVSHRKSLLQLTSWVEPSRIYIAGHCQVPPYVWRRVVQREKEA